MNFTVSSSTVEYIEDTYCVSSSYKCTYNSDGSEFTLSKITENGKVEYITIVVIYPDKE